MAATSTSVWKTIILVAAVVLVIAMTISGFLGWGIALLLLLLVMGGGALLYRTMGPPER